MPRKIKVKRKLERTDASQIDPAFNEKALVGYKSPDKSVELITFKEKQGNPDPKGKEYEFQLLILILPRGMKRVKSPKDTGHPDYGAELFDGGSGKTASGLVAMLHEIAPGAALGGFQLPNHKDTHLIDIKSISPHGACATRAYPGTDSTNSIFVEWDFRKSYDMSDALEARKFAEAETTFLRLGMIRRGDNSTTVRMVLMIMPNHSLLWIPCKVDSNGEPTTDYSNLFAGDATTANFRFDFVRYLDGPDIFIGAPHRP